MTNSVTITPARKAMIALIKTINNSDSVKAKSSTSNSDEPPKMKRKT